jgi:uncharacterized SAM-binding protein YcdF (DUF218 family)
LDSLFFLASKLIWLLIRPESWLAGTFLIGILALWAGRLRAAKVLLTTALLALVTIGIFPLGLILIAPLEARHPPAPALQEIAGIIVLGGGEEADRWGASGEIALNEAGERFLAGIALAHRFPDTPLLFTGGSPRLIGTGPATRSLAEAIFQAGGIAPERILIEDRARNTAENASLTLELLETLDSVTPNNDAPWILVTSAFHMPRAMASFEAAGWTTLTPWPTDFRGGVFRARIGWHLARNLDELNLATKEWLGILAYRLTGRAL